MSNSSPAHRSALIALPADVGRADRGDDHERDRQPDRELEERLLDPPPRAVDRVGAAERAAEALALGLQQDRDRQHDREQGLHDEEYLVHALRPLVRPVARNLPAVYHIPAVRTVVRAGAAGKPSAGSGAPAILSGAG